MKLSEQDVNLFFELMWSLQFFVNRKFDILKGILKKVNRALKKTMTVLNREEY